ncbi:MAG: hypothetical protein VYE22_18415 [Myxococcota bacterium]|nr:hypothetical protein [Myxococcota bacterium]
MRVEISGSRGQPVGALEALRGEIARTLQGRGVRRVRLTFRDENRLFCDIEVELEGGARLESELCDLDADRLRERTVSRAVAMAERLTAMDALFRRSS